MLIGVKKHFLWCYLDISLLGLASESLFGLTASTSCLELFSSSNLSQLKLSPALVVSVLSIVEVKQPFHQLIAAKTVFNFVSTVSFSQ